MVIEDKSLGVRIFKIFNYIFLIFLGLICVLPIIHVFAISLSSKGPVAANQVTFWPVQFQLKAYQEILVSDGFWRAFLISSLRVIFGTVVNLLVIVLAAYPLSRSSKRFKGRNVLMWFFVIPMLFNGGLIPTYLLIRNLGLIDNYTVLILNQGVVQLFSIIVLMNFFRTLPDSLFEAAMIDGASHWTILFRLFIPLSKASLATLTLWAMVGHWNEWFMGLIYMNDATQYPLQTYLRQLLKQIDFTHLSFDDLEFLKYVSNRTFKAAQIFVATIPMLCVYPFLQQYFVKGIVLGAVKE